MLFACCGKLAEANSAWNLKGRTAVVTGGSKGIGRGVVEELLEQGCRVITCARDCGPLDSLLCEVNSQISSECVSSAQREEPGLPRLIALPLDVSTGEGVDALVACVEEHFQGRLDILVNNVGTNVRKAAEDFSDAEYDLLMRTNLDAAFHLSRKCLRFLSASNPKRRSRCTSERNDDSADAHGGGGDGDAVIAASDADDAGGGDGVVGGCVVNIGSISGETVDNTGCPYHMAKAAMNHMTRYLACEWGPSPHAVRVNCVAPWFIATPLTEPILKGAFASAVDRATPLRRVGTTQEVARVVSFLCMEASSYVSGQVVTVDGAFTCDGFRYENP